MADFLYLMRDDGPPNQPPEDWDRYLSDLGAKGVLRGGSAIGGGESARKTGAPAPLSVGVTGFIRIVADDLAHARRLLAGNPVYEAGGTVEVRELPVTR